MSSIVISNILLAAILGAAVFAPIRSVQTFRRYLGYSILIFRGCIIAGVACYRALRKGQPRRRKHEVYLTICLLILVALSVIAIAQPLLKVVGPILWLTSLRLAVNLWEFLPLIGELPVLYWNFCNATYHWIEKAVCLNAAHCLHRLTNPRHSPGYQVSRRSSQQTLIYKTPGLGHM